MTEKELQELIGDDYNVTDNSDAITYSSENDEETADADNNVPDDPDTYMETEEQADDKVSSESNPKAKKKGSLVTLIVDICVSAIALTTIGICAFKYLDFINQPIPEPPKTPISDINVDIADIKIKEEAKKEPQILDEYKEWYDINNDLIGWIRIDGTNIDNPVTQVKGQFDGKDWGYRYEQNMYYISRDFYKNESRSGCIFVDFQDQFTSTHRPANTLIYGHNMSSGLFFHDVAYYDPIYCWYADGVTFYKEHPTITFDTIYEKGTYKVFAAMQTNVDNKDGKIFNYTPICKFKNEAAFLDYYGQVLDRSLFYNPDVDIKYGDEIIALSTCDFTVFSHILDIRFVVYARRVREGESADVDVSKYYVNDDPLMYDAYYNTYGGSWEGRKWPEALIKKRYE